jgi:hypothetical protein
MRHWLLASSIVVAVFGTCTGDLSACGDKFLLLGRPTGYQQLLKASRPAVILVYSTPQLPAVFNDGRFGTVMEIAGHHSLTVNDRSMLARTLTSSRVDIVLADPAISRAIATDVQAASKAFLIPVLANGSSSERSQLEKQFGAILRLPADALTVVHDLDKAMKMKAKRERA